MRRAVALIVLLVLSACGGGGDGGGSGSANRAPTITSAGSTTVAENVTGTVYQATATDPDGNPITLSLGGTDSTRFTIAPGGAVSFVTPPDFEAPTDLDHNNVYLIDIVAYDGALETRLSVTITVTNTPDQLSMRRIGNFFQLTDIAAIPGSLSIFGIQADGKVYQVGPTDAGPGTLYMTVPGITGNARIISLLPDRNYATSGQLYVYLLNAGGQLELRRYGRLPSGLGDPGSEDVLLRTATVPLPAAPSGNRRASGGGMRFGPDGLLYIGVGVGRTEGTDPAAASPASDLSQLMGKVLRIDVSRDDFPADTNRDYGIPAGNPFAGGGGAGEIYAWGFENPSTLQIDGTNVFVGDSHVPWSAQNVPAEVNLIRPQDAGGNYGFPLQSGPGIIAPVIQLNVHGLFPDAKVAVGPVYRGPIAQIAGQLLFNDPSVGGLLSHPAASIVQGTTLTSGFTAQNSIAALITPDTSGAIIRMVVDDSNNLYLMTDGGLWAYMLIVV